MALLPLPLPLPPLQPLPRLHHLNDVSNDLPYPIILVSDLCQIHTNQRSIFLVFVGILAIVSFVGNIGTLYVNFRRKLRPFFRCCLIALACSDLLYSISYTTAYVAHFNAKYLDLWILGRFMCSLVPFINTATIMFSSLILVAIALDRYMAIRRAATTIWNPSWLFSGLCIGGISLTSVVFSAPLFIITDYKHVYLQPTEELVVSELQLANMCMGMSGAVGIYNVVLLSLIFLPCVVGFVFLNATIARRLWQRRHYHPGKPQFVYLLSKPETTYALMTAFSVAASLDHSASKMIPYSPSTVTSTSTVTTTSASQTRSSAQKQTEYLSPAAAARVARHRRMVHVVILMMAAFMGLRLPAWIFLILRLYGTFSSPVDWLLYFSFGLLNLTSSALNPLFYTFLTQTIRCLSKLKQKLQRLFCCCCHQPKSDADANADTAAKSKADTAMPKESVGSGCCCWCGVKVTWHCYHKTVKTPVDNQQSPAEALPVNHISDLTGNIFTIYSENSLATRASSESSS